MTPSRSIALRGETMRLINEYRLSTHDLRPIDDMVNDVILLWLAQQAGFLGYRWKQVFLPDGTRLRINARGCTEIAQVFGDQLMYRGGRSSPHAFAEAAAGEGRNAWRLLEVWRPHDTHWWPAQLLRRKASGDAFVPGLAGED